MGFPTESWTLGWLQRETHTNTHKSIHAAYIGPPVEHIFSYSIEVNVSGSSVGLQPSAITACGAPGPSRCPEGERSTNRWRFRNHQVSFSWKPFWHFFKQLWNKIHTRPHTHTYKGNDVLESICYEFSKKKKKDDALTRARDRFQSKTETSSCPIMLKRQNYPQRRLNGSYDICFSFVDR